MMQGSVPADAYRLFFIQSRWPSVIVDRTRSLILDSNQSWEALGHLHPQSDSIHECLKLDISLEQVDQAELCQGSFSNGQPDESFLCQISPLKNNLLSIECYWPEQNSLSHEYEHLKNLNQRKSDLIANISHELRTPLTAILGWPEILLDTQGMPSLVLQAAEAIRKDGVFLRDLLEDLIDLSKIEAGHLDLNLKSENLCQIALDAVEMLSEKARKKELSLKVDLPEEPIVAFVDAMRVMQILLNYLSNAVKYTPAGGSIHLSVGIQNEEAVISICDNGIGMNETVRQKAFERFMRAEEVSLLDGAGIGLSLVKKLVQLHNGHCWVKSEVGKGSCFYVALPLDVQDNPIHVQTKALKDRPEDLLSRSTLFLISDQAEERQIFNQLLRASVNTIHPLSEPPPPQNMVIESNLEMILLSTSLERHDHLNWLSKFREARPNTLVIALSSSAMKGDQEILLSKGYSAVLVKPFLKEDLLQCMQQILTGISNV